MALSKDGDRPRFFSERKQLAARQGDPIHDGVSPSTRERICREIAYRAWFRDKAGNHRPLSDTILNNANRVFLRSWQHRMSLIEHDPLTLNLDDFLQFVEISVQVFVEWRHDPVADIDVINSLLADDFSIYRIIDMRGGNPAYQVHKIDNEHLHTVIADRTFELTQVAGLVSAQGDYADAWRHYSKGDLDDAISNAGKAVESACKAVIKKVDPSSTPDNMNLGPLVGELVRLDVIPQQLTHTCTHLEQIFRGSGTLRNQAGAAHGSLDPTTPAASTALLALRLSGTLIAFLAERWAQMKP